MALLYPTVIFHSKDLDFARHHVLLSTAVIVRGAEEKGVRSTHLFRVAANAVPFADGVALDVVTVGGAFAVEVRPGCSTSASPYSRWSARLKAVRTVVDVGSPPVAQQQRGKDRTRDPT